MKRQMLWKKGRQVFAAILSASMLVTSVMPEAMISVAAEEITADAGEEEPLVQSLEEEEVENEEESGENAEEENDQEEDSDIEETESMSETEESSDSEQTVGDAEAEAEEESIRMELMDELNARISALPSVEEFEKMTEDEQNSVLEEVNAIADQYYDELSGAEQELVQAEKLDAMLEYMSSQVAVMSNDSDHETVTPNAWCEPITISDDSMNGNAIWGATEEDTNIAMDDSAYLYSASRFEDGGLPTNGNIVMLSGIPYYLSAAKNQYDGNDCIRLQSENTSKTMDLQTIGAYDQVYVLATAGGPGSGNYAKFKVTLTYTDNTTSETTYQLYDWYDTRDVDEVEKYFNIRRINMSDKGVVESNSSSTGTPVLHSAAIDAEGNKLLKSITFSMLGKNEDTSTDGLYCCIFAVTGKVNGNVPASPVATEATNIGTDEVTLANNKFTANWKAVANAESYSIDVSEDENFTSFVNGYNNYNIKGTNTSCIINNLEKGHTYYYRVRGKNSHGQSLSSNTIEVSLCDHEWLDVTVNENEITTTCIAKNNEKCKYRNGISVVLDADDSSYNGEPYSSAENVSISGVAEFHRITGKEISVNDGYTYYLKDGEVETRTTNSNSGAASEGGAPVNAGRYVVKKDVEVDNTTLTVAKEFTIQPKKITEEMVTLAQDELAYDKGNLLSPTVNVKDGNITINDYKLDGTTSANQVGEYTIQIIGTGNYTGTIEKIWRIKGSDFADGDITFYVENMTYNKTPQSNYEVQLKGTAADAEVTYYTYTGFSSEKPTFTNAGTYNVRYKVHKDGYNDVISDWKKVTVAPKTISIIWGNTSLTYNGEKQLPTVSAGNVEEGDSCELNVTGAQIAPGSNYTAEVTGIKYNEDYYYVPHNYQLPSEGRTTTFSISKANRPAPNVQKTNETIKGKADGAITDVTSEMEYRKAEETNYNEIPESGLTNLAAGTYYVRYKGNDYYNASADKEVTIAEGKMLTVSVPEDQVGYTLTVDHSEVEYNGKSTLNFNLNPGYSKTDSFAVYINEREIDLSETGNYVIDQIESNTTITVGGVADITKPTGKIRIGDTDVTFDPNKQDQKAFFADQAEAIIIGEDAGSGVAKIEYQVISNTSGKDQPEEAAWTTAENNSFTVEANKNCVIYARITDNAGNVTILHSSDIIVYTNVTGSNKASYTRTTGEDMVTDIALNGNTVKEIKYGDKVLEKGVDYVINEDGKLVINGQYLEKLPAGEYELTVSWNPFGENQEGASGTTMSDSTINVYVNRAEAESAGTRITNADKLSKTYDGQPVEEITSESKNSSTPVVEYKKKDAADTTYTTEIPKDAGSYVVRVTYPQNDDYEKSVVTEDFVIRAKKLKASISNIEKTYDGTDTATVTAKVATGIDGESLTITGLTGKYEDKNAGINKVVNIDSTNVEVNGTSGTNPENYEISYPTTGNGYIWVKTLKIRYEAIDKEYDGTNKVQCRATVDTGITGEELTITGSTGTVEDADAGEGKTVTFDGNATITPKEVAQNYYFGMESPTGTGTIRPKSVNLDWSDTDLTYTGKEQSVTAKVANAIGKDQFTLTYDANKATSVGNYIAKVTDLGNPNYTLENATGVTANWSISYLTVEDKNLPVTSGKKEEGNDWYTGNVTLIPGSGYLISTSEDPDGTWSDSLTFDADGEKQITYYLKDEQGHITEAKTLTIKKDATAPIGEIKAQDTDLTASGDAGSKYFFKDNADITISAADATSGVAKIEYQIVSKASGDEYQEDDTWTEGQVEGTSLTIKANDNCVIYARITDKAGNVTILHSNDIIVYTEVTGSKEASYTRTTGEDMVTDIALEGNTVKEIKYGDKVLKEDEDYGVEDGKLVISSKYLEKLPAGEHELTVSWNPFGENQEEAAGTIMADSTIKISVKRADPASTETRITNTGKFSKTYDGQPAEKATSESKNRSTPVVEYKKKDAADTTYTTEIPRDAGSYVVRVTYPQNGDYEASVVTEEFTIAPKEIGISWNGTSFVYNGKQQAPTATATGLFGTDQCEITVNGAQTATGKYTATAVSVSNANYCLPKTGTTADFEIKEVSDKAATGLALNAGLKVSQTGSSIGIKWGRVKGADGYNVYVQYCGSKFTAKSLNQVKSGSKSSLTVKKVNGKKLNLKKNYKIYVEAYKNVNGQKIVMGRSVVAHIVGRQNSKYTNVKGIKLQKNAFTLKTGKTAAVKATTVKVNRYRKQLSDAHAKELRYATSNPAVATVNAKGKIRAVGKGSCTIYVYARNGYTKKVKVTVK